MKNWKTEFKIKGVSKGAIFMYVVALFTFLYFAYTFYTAAEYIGAAMKQGQVTLGGNFGQIIQYFVSNTGSYLFYTISLIFYGRVLSNNHNKNLKGKNILKMED